MTSDAAELAPKMLVTPSRRVVSPYWPTTRNGPDTATTRLVAPEDGPQTGQGEGAAGLRCTPSSNAACCQGLGAGGRSAVGGAVSRMNLSRAATTAAVSSGEAAGAIN